MKHSDLIRRLVRLVIITLITYIVATKYLFLQTEQMAVLTAINISMFMLIDTFYPRIHYQKNI